MPTGWPIWEPIIVTLEKGMKLAALLGDDAACPASARELLVTGITGDSRQVKPGMVFVAISGSRADGTKFVGHAIENGAMAIVAASDAGLDTSLDTRTAVIRVPEPRRLLAQMAGRFYRLQPNCIMAVTGTSGKTSVADFTRQILVHIGRAAASIGTIGIVKPDGGAYGSLTTPDPVTLHRDLKTLHDEGISHVVLEASSHGLDQRRLDGVTLSAAAFANFGRDHLDYHATLDDYFAAKLRLFQELLDEGKPAVVNMDGARASDVCAIVRERKQRLITVGLRGETLKLDAVSIEGFSQRLTIEFEGRKFNVSLPLVGGYQVENAMTAAGLAIAVGEDVGHVTAALGRLKGVVGRLDIVGEKDGALVIVDYAHKPEALEAALAAVRPFASGRVICVFGCGGDRDRGKRPIMGRIAAARAEKVVVTDDNPRHEDPARIRQEILAGAPDADNVADRGEAIAAGNWRGESRRCCADCG